jgi:hypothetical protein
LQWTIAALSPPETFINYIYLEYKTLELLTPVS